MKIVLLSFIVLLLFNSSTIITSTLIVLYCIVLYNYHKFNNLRKPVIINVCAMFLSMVSVNGCEDHNSVNSVQYITMRLKSNWQSSILQQIFRYFRVSKHQSKSRYLIDHHSIDLTFVIDHHTWMCENSHNDPSLFMTLRGL